MPVDELLVHDARRGDRTAFDRLQRKIEPRVRRFIRRLIGTNGAAESIVQDTFLALYVKIERIESVEHLWSFVFRVVRHLCYDELRRQGRWNVVAINHGGDRSENDRVLQDRAPAVDTAAHWSLGYAKIREAIDLLPEVQRQTIILRFEEDLSYEQVAEAMDVDIGTVKSRIHNARKSLRSLVGPEWLRAMGIGKENTDGGNR